MPYGYVSEILPYGLRSKGLAIAVAANQTGNGFNQWVSVPYDGIKLINQTRQPGRTRGYCLEIVSYSIAPRCAQGSRAHVSSYFLYVGLLIMFYLIIYFFFPETKGGRLSLLPRPLSAC